MFGDEEISVREALKLKAQERRQLRCTACGERAHKASSNGMAPHFEHLAGNPRCRLSDSSTAAR